MTGLFYRLVNGTELYICKHWLPERINEVKRALINHSHSLRCMFDYNSFEHVCGEQFNPKSLFSKPIAVNACIYPMYRIEGIVWTTSQDNQA
jgi:hypothetical protein